MLTVMMRCGPARAADSPSSAPRPGGQAIHPRSTSAQGGAAFAVRGHNAGFAFSPIAYGAVGDARVCENDASIDAQQRVLTSPSGHFTSADTGKPITIPGAGPEAMLGVGILTGSRSGSNVHMVLGRPAAAGLRIYARYWSSIRPFVDRSKDCSIAAGSQVVTCSRQSFPASYRWALAVVPGAGPLDPGTSSNSPLVSRINAVTPTTLRLDGVAAAAASNQDVTVWLRYEESHGVTRKGQTVVSFAAGTAPLPESLNVSVGALDATDVAATDLATTIRSVSNGRATLVAGASTTVRSAACRFGTDDWRAFQSALDAAARGPVTIGWPWGVASTGNGRVDIAPGRAYYIGAPLTYKGSNLELRATGAPIYYGGSGTFLRLGEAGRAGTCTKPGLTALYDIDGLFVIGSFNAAVGVAVPCAGQTHIDKSLLQGFVENLDIGLPGANGTSPDTKITRTFVDRGVTNLWVHNADLFTFSDGGYYGYRDRGMVLCGDDNPDTLCHSLRIDSVEGAAHFLSAAAGLDAGNIDGFEFRDVYDEPGVLRGVPEGCGPALRFGYVGSPHGGVVTGGTWSGNKVDTAVQFNATGSAGLKSDVAFFGNYLVNWNVAFDLGGAKRIFAGPNRFEPRTITGAHYVDADPSDSIIDGGFWSRMGTVVGPAMLQTPNSSQSISALKIGASHDPEPRYNFVPGIGMRVSGGTSPATTVIDENADVNGKAISASALAAGPFFSFSRIYSAAAKPIPPCNGSRLHWRACASDAPACISGQIYGGGGALTPCEVWCDGRNWIQSGSGC
ncbi:MAG TPA: hypothetical protein VFE56_12835 [Candidatus Binataceae bacterium]|nr:hypothetical protein [Candidatus Binataceae bacterium]